jgi:ABC-type oligopeptide transport system ATPase subunit
VFISHDLSLVSHISDEIAVMHDGKIVEYGPADQVAGNPQHPYTRSLIAAIPGERRRNRSRAVEAVAPLESLVNREHEGVML